MGRGSLICSLLIAAILLSTATHAVAIGVNRASLDFSNVLRGGYAEAVVTVTTDSEEPIDAEVLVVGEAKDWFNFSAVAFNFSRDNPYELRVMVQPPSDAQLQDYHVNLSVTTGTIARSEGGKMGTSTRASFRIPVKVRMTGTEHIECLAGGVRVLDTERGQPVELRLSVLNQGNVRINPDIIVEVFDQGRSHSMGSKSVDFGGRVLPTVTAEGSRILPMDLSPGQYWASVKVPLCNYANLMTFDVLEPGGIKDDGDFIRIDAPSWANTSDILEIKAIFRNRGVRGVRAAFKGTITLQETQEIVKVISTDEYIVDPDSTAEIPTFFNPQVGGQYVISGRIYYNNKLTTERNTIINVNGSPVSKTIMSRTWVIVIAIAIAVLLLLILIKKRRDDHS